MRKRVTLPLCSSTVKVSPQEALDRRAELIAGEDDGCAGAGGARQVLQDALDSVAAPARQLWYLRYGGSRDSGFVDVLPGWRLRVITPLLRSGGYKLSSPALTGDGKTLEIHSDGDFLGMETAFYSIEQGGRTRLERVEALVGGKQEIRDTPRVQMFDMPPQVRHLRLVYLTRLSQSDHDMAVLGARFYRDLQEATVRFEQNPAQGCVSDERVHCRWVPAGIAVLPQVPVSVNEVTRWVPLNSTVGDLIRELRTTDVSLRRPWRGTLIPVQGAIEELRRLPLLGGEEIKAPLR